MSSSVDDVVARQLELLARLAEALRVMREILEPAARGIPLESEAKLAASPSALEDLDSLASQVTDQPSWQLVRDEVALRAAQARMEFGPDLEAAFERHGLAWSGAFPLYKIAKQVIQVDVSKGVIRVGRRAWAMTNPNETARLLAKSTTKASRQHPVAAPDFGLKFRDAYASAGTILNNASGDYISVVKVYEAVKKQMPRGYSRDVFARDLAREATGDATIEFATSRHPRHGIRIPIGEGVLVGSLRIKTR